MIRDAIPQIGNIPNVMPSAAENANCLGSAPLHITKNFLALSLTRKLWFSDQILAKSRKVIGINKKKKKGTILHK